MAAELNFSSFIACGVLLSSSNVSALTHRVKFSATRTNTSTQLQSAPKKRNVSPFAYNPFGENVYLHEGDEETQKDKSWKPPQDEAYKYGVFTSPVELITFDAIDTLIQLRAPVGSFYRDALLEATGFRARLPGPAVFDASFIEAYQEMDEIHPCYGSTTGVSSEDWWYQVVKKTYDKTQILEAGIKDELNDWMLDPVFETLYYRMFTTDEAWELKPGILEALSYFAQWRIDGGPALGVLSNMDNRLPALLQNLGVDEAFDFIFTSDEIKAAKPDCKAFLYAMNSLDLVDPGSCMHIGDGFREDIIGAAEAGWHAVHLPPRGEFYVPAEASDNLVYSMAGDLFDVLNMFGKDNENRIVAFTTDRLEYGHRGIAQKWWGKPRPEKKGSRRTVSDMDKRSWQGAGRF